MGMARRRMVSGAAPPSPAPPGPALDEASRLRLLGLGLDEAELDALDLREAPCALPAGWLERGNRLYCGRSVSVPPSFVAGNQALSSVSDCLMVLASPIDNLAVVLAEGRGGTLYVGPECWLPAAQVFFGAGSSIVLRALVTCTWAGILDARNGGTIFADRDQLWASNVYIATDDMHALRSRTTGERLNPHGAHIRLGSHVWVGRDSAVTGNTTLGNDSVVGMRSIVRNKQFPANVAVAGTPARIMRTDVTWSREDLP
ncbi:MAG: hypothetical protein L0Y64_14615 [Myxococcaceae bacterium]|nr:hypothetical protein [Myxococcaceae bacterium]